jgi:hypothetical protein
MLGADVASLLRAVGAHDRNVPLAADLCNADAPRIAANLTILNKSALHIGFDVDLDLLPAVRACHDELVIHGWTRLRAPTTVCFAPRFVKRLLTRSQSTLPFELLPEDRRSGGVVQADI